MRSSPGSPCGTPHGGLQTSPEAKEQALSLSCSNMEYSSLFPYNKTGLEKQELPLAVASTFRGLAFTYAEYLCATGGTHALSSRTPILQGDGSWVLNFPLCAALHAICFHLRLLSLYLVMNDSKQPHIYQRPLALRGRDKSGSYVHPLPSGCIGPGSGIAGQIDKHPRQSHQPSGQHKDYE